MNGELCPTATVVRLEDATARVQHPSVARKPGRDKDLNEARLTNCLSRLVVGIL
jgi:hypothetical protein